MKQKKLNQAQKKSDEIVLLPMHCARGPRGPSVAGRGAHVSPMGNFSGGQTKKI